MRERERERENEQESTEVLAKVSHSVPDDNIYVFAGGSVGVLGCVQVEEITVMVIKVDP